MAQAFDLAFGIDRYLIGFASLFAQSPALPFLYWPDFMVTYPTGEPIRLMDKQVFRREFQYMIQTYLTVFPEGRFRFNLGGMDNSIVQSMTNWELKTLSTQTHFMSQLDCYIFEGTLLTPLTPLEAQQRIQFILNRQT